jgi:hypothetical protein
MVWCLPQADAELGAVARSRCKQLHPSLGQKKFNLVTWLPRQNRAASVGLLVLGDSYADHFDMGFECWQTLLARQCRLSSLNVACGGARISQYRSQLATATAACEELGLRHSAETLVVVHAGGNDFLHALMLPPLLPLLLLDIVRCGARRALGLPRFKAASPPLLSFVGLSARWLALQLRLLVAALHRLGYRRVLVSGPVITPSLPLARTVVTLLMLGLVRTLAPPLGPSPTPTPTATATPTPTPKVRPSFVDATLRDFGELLASTARDEVLPRLESRHDGMQLAFFDGAGELTQLAARADEERHGVLGTLRLLAALRRPTPRTTFWRDGHHPTALVHAELALRARAALSNAGLLPPPAAAVSAGPSAKASASQHGRTCGEHQGPEAPQAPLLGT